MGVTIGIDLRCLPADGSPGAGVAHAARDVTRALIALPVDVRWKLFIPSGAVWKDDDRVVRLQSSNGRALRAALTKHPCDLLFVPSGTVAPGVQVPVIPWVHDIAIFAQPKWFGESLVRRAITTRLFLRGIRSARYVLSVSQSSKDEMVDRFNLEAADITVTSEGGDPVLATLYGESLHEAKNRARYRIFERGMTNPFILFLGTVEPRKNLPVLLEAWLRARSRFQQPVDLVIAGRDGWKLRPIHHAMDLTRRFSSEGPSHLHRVVALSDEDRRDLLLAAELVAVPSLHEGFGLVALEAMQAATAVIVSTAGALPEVVGEHGATVPPRDSRAWAEALVHVLSDDASRHHLAEQGKARSQGMTWERTAKIIYDVLTG
jgi:glycosyltransferase involved in cell wall biosynthesis